MQRNKQAKQANTIAERQTLLGRKSKRSSHYEFREMRNSATGTIHLRAAKAKAQLSSERRAKRRAEQSDEQSSTQSPTQLRAQEQSRSARGQAAKPWRITFVFAFYMPLVNTEFRQDTQSRTPAQQMPPRHWLRSNHWKNTVNFT